MRSTFRVLFYLKKSTPKKNGFVPVMCRVTVDGTISQFSCKLDIDPLMWDMKSSRATGRSTVALETNRHLDKIRVGINAKYKEIAERDNYVSAEKVRNAFLGLEMRYETLMKVYAQHNEDFAKQVGKIKCKSTYHKYCTVYKHLEQFIKTRYRVSDIALKELTPAFITDFELFLRTDKNCSHNTVWIYMMPLRRMVTIAQNNGWIVRDPFAGYEIGMESVDRGYLTKDEIRLLLDAKFDKKKTELIRDLYVFCCFTFLALINKHQFISKLQFNQGVIGNDLETTWLRCYALVFVFQIAIAKLQKIILPTIISSIHIPIQHTISIEEKLFTHKFTLNKDSFVCCSEYHQGVVYRSC